MMLADATLLPRAATDVAGCPWFDRIVPGMSVGALISTVTGSQPHHEAPLTSEEVLSALLALEERGQLDIALRRETRRLHDVYAHLEGLREPPLDSSMAYVTTYERNWREQAALYDFVDAPDANGRIKAFERDIYLYHLACYMDELPPGASVLDAGCGVGRLAEALIGKRYRVSCVDTSAIALKCAARHLLHAGARVDDVRMHLCDVREMRMFAPNSFDATFALEVICYQNDPAESLAELGRVTAPGGLIFMSVEGAYGSLIADAKITCDHAPQVLDRGILDIPGEITVHYFSAPGVRSLVEQCGLECLSVTGTHYVPDGILNRLVENARLDHPPVRESALALELRCSTDPVLQPLARAWLAVCRKGFDT